MGRFSEKEMKRFWSKVDKELGCWQWIGSIATHGYGKTQIRRKDYRPHRVAYEIEYGCIPDSMLVCHHCDNKLCVRPSHLFLGTQQDNMNDCVRKGRTSKGEHRPLSKLTEEKVETIKADTRKYKEIAKEYNVAVSTVGRIKTGERWRHTHQGDEIGII